MDWYQKSLPFTKTAEPEVGSVAPNRVTDKTTNEDKYNNNSYPINKNIYTETLTGDYQGQPYQINIQFGRVRNYDKKTRPEYLISFFMEGRQEPIFETTIKPSADRAWSPVKRRNNDNIVYKPKYDEDALITQCVEQAQRALDGKKSALYERVSGVFEAKKYSDDYALFFEMMYGDYDDIKEAKRFFAEQTTAPKIDLSSIGHAGEFYLKPVVSGGYNGAPLSLDFVPFVDSPMAPDKGYSSVEYVQIPRTIKSFEELNEFMINAVNKNHEAYVKAYEKYLKTFAFTEEEQDQSRAELKPIVDMIRSKFMDISFFKQELMKRGYIRPSKRGRKNVGVGMVPQSQVQLIIDSKAIREATYSALDSQVDTFYSAIAYNLLRIKDDNIGFMPIALMDSYNEVRQAIKRFYGEDISTEDISKYISSVASQLYTNLTNKQYKNWEEVYQDFYTNNWGASSQAPQGAAWGQSSTNSLDPLDPLDTFAKFVANLEGQPIETVRQTPKKFYHMLVKKYHPDSSTLNPAEANKVFVQLSSLYSAIPQEKKLAITLFRLMKAT